MPVDQKKKAEAFRALHHRPEVLLLANVWDVASACIVEQAGFPAIATTSAGIAFSHGLPDGQKISPERMFAAIAEIARGVAVPVTADVEAGYGDTPEAAARTAQSVIEAGAVGMNLEDGTGDAAHRLVELPLQVEKLRAIRETSGRLGVPLVINARSDVYLLQVGESSNRYDETVRRLSGFREAGADCVFVPGLKDLATIERLVADLRCPVNILAGPGSPLIPQLAAAGVKRVSLGSGPMRATLGLLRRMGQELMTSGTYSAMEDAPPHSEMNELMRRIQN